MPDIIISILPSGIENLQKVGLSDAEIKLIYDADKNELNLSRLDVLLGLHSKVGSFSESEKNYLTLLLLEDCSVNFTNLPHGFGSLLNIEAAVHSPSSISYIRAIYNSGALSNEEKVRASVFMDDHASEAIWLSFAASGFNVEPAQDFTTWLHDELIPKDLEIALEHNPFSDNPLRPTITPEENVWGYGLTSETIAETYSQYFPNSETITEETWEKLANNGLIRLANVYHLQNYPEWKRNELAKDPKNLLLTRKDSLNIEDRTQEEFQKYFISDFMPAIAKAAEEEGIPLEYYVHMLERSGWNMGSQKDYAFETTLSELQNFISSTIYHAESSDPTMLAWQYLQDALNNPEEYKTLDPYQRFSSITSAKGNGGNGNTHSITSYIRENFELTNEQEEKLNLVDLGLDYLANPSQKTEARLGRALSESTPVAFYDAIRFPIPTFGINDQEAEILANGLITREGKMKEMYGDNSQQVQEFLYKYKDLLQYSHELINAREGLNNEKTKYQDLTNEYLNTYAMERLRPLLDPEYTNDSGEKLTDEERKELWEETGLLDEGRLKWLMNYSMLWKNTDGWWQKNRDKAIDDGVDTTIYELTELYAKDPVAASRTLLEDVIYD